MLNMLTLNQSNITVVNGAIKFLFCALLFFSFAHFSMADDFTDTKDKLESAINMPHRSETNTVRDSNRLPVDTMSFCGLRDDMTVIEFGPGNGWYSEILGPVLNDKGRLLIAYKDEWMEKLNELLSNEFMSSTEKHPIDIAWNSEEKRFDVGDVHYNVENADLALNIREYHNFNSEGADKVNQATFAALKPGGLYCIVDHTRRHMESLNTENRRRADPVSVILAVQAAGFNLIGSSDLHFKPDDELRYEVGRKSVTGNTDRFSLLFQKPL